MKILKRLSLRKSSNIKLMVCVSLIPSTIFYTFLLIFFYLRGSNLAYVLRDISQSCGNIVSWGIFSNIGILLWASSASVSLFSFFVPIQSNKSRLNSFLLSGSIFSIILCLDDFFLIHERFINERLVSVFYVILSFVLLIKFWKIIRNNFFLFFLPSFLLGISLLIDNLQNLFLSHLLLSQILEEGFKFSGISCWLYFWIFISMKKIRSLTKVNNNFYL